MIHHGDALTVLKAMPSESVRCCVTSPPYWGLRDYGTATWTGGADDCDHIERASARNDTTRERLAERAAEYGTGQGNGSQVSAVQYRETCKKCGAVRVDDQLGLEKTPDEYVAKMVAVFAEVRRVLRADGTLWLNIGDSYAGGGGFCPGAPSTATSRSGQRGLIGALKQGGVPVAPGLKPKDLVGIPWRLAFALQADGWFLRSEIIWSKSNPMPESVTDRPTKAHEQVFLLAKSGRYYYDADAIREDHARDWAEGKSGGSLAGRGMRFTPEPGDPNYRGGSSQWERDRAPEPNPNGRNARTVWTIATNPFPGAHFAVMPTELVERCILAGTKRGDTVLDPFFGAGTTGLMARKLKRDWIGIELNREYIEIARQRLGGSLFADQIPVAEEGSP